MNSHDEVLVSRVRPTNHSTPMTYRHAFNSMCLTLLHCLPSHMLPLFSWSIMLAIIQAACLAIRGNTRAALVVNTAVPLVVSVPMVVGQAGSFPDPVSVVPVVVHSRIIPASALFVGIMNDPRSSP